MENTIESNKDFRYDLKIGELFEEQLASILSDKTIEVKTDLKYKYTGNIFIETRSRGKLSGLTITKADFYAFILPSIDNTPCVAIFKTDRLKSVLKTMYKKDLLKTIKGGDNGTSSGFLVKLNKLIYEYGKFRRD